MEEKSEISGIVVVDKPTNMTSRDIVNILEQEFHTKKVGHTGTLDPLATGVLICTLNKCTKLNEFLMSKDKEYEVTLLLGKETDTLDITGKTTKTSSKIVTRKEIKDILNSFVGSYNQKVPLYSAVKVDGKRLYEYAREGEEVELPSRVVEIKSIDNIKVHHDLVSFTTVVSKGTYIRSLVRDIGEKVGTYACMFSLRRTRQGVYTTKDANTLNDIMSGNTKVLSIKDIFKDYPNIEVDNELYKKIINGNAISFNSDKEYILFTKNNEDICIYKKEDDKYKMYLKLI